MVCNGPCSYLKHGITIEQGMHSSPCKYLLLQTSFVCNIFEKKRDYVHSSLVLVHFCTVQFSVTVREVIIYHYIAECLGWRLVL